MTDDLEAEMKAIDWYSATVRRLHGVPAGWKWFSIDGHDKPDDFVLIRGDVPIGVRTRGINKGHPKWGPFRDSRAFWVRMSDVEETKRLYESEMKAANA